MQKRLTTSKVDIPHAKRHRFIKIAVHGVGIEEFQAMIGRATGNEAMHTLKITEQSCQLEPEALQMTKRGGWCWL
jgi:hypothetical protein